MRASNAATSSSPSTSAPSHLKVTLMRSTIGLTPKVRKTAIALGFKKRLQSVIHAVKPGLIGQILGVKELVKVENMTVDMIREEKRRKAIPRSANKGYAVVGSAL